MARLPRIQVEGSLYYVTCRSHHSNELFKDGQDYDKYLDLLANYKNKYHFKLFSYCLLSDKVYLLIGINSESSISEIMFNLNSSYTKYYNARQGKKGAVLEGRFKSKWIEKITYLLPLTRYIHLISNKNSTYVSYSAFLGASSPIPMADEIQEVLSYLQQGVDYKTYVEKVDLKELKDLEQKLERNRILGSKEFEYRVKTAFKAYKENREKKITAEKVVFQKHIPKNLPRRFEKYQRGLLWGSVAVSMLLLLLAGYFYSRQLFWKEEFEQKLVELNKPQVHPVDNISGVQPADSIDINGVQPNVSVSPARPPTNGLRAGFAAGGISMVENITHPLEGIVLEIKLEPISSEVSQNPQRDTLKFKEGKVVSNVLTKEGFGPSNYSLTYKEKGVVVWETMQSGLGGAVASWHGKWNGEVMKGVLSQKFPGEEAKTFSFIGYLKTST
ncbi:MAG: transposase [Candidatus Ratteibacteria bacterium]|nr:transposase [Candidatus Ratteibacteria bacterium]